MSKLIYFILSAVTLIYVLSEGSPPNYASAELIPLERSESYFVNPNASKKVASAEIKAHLKIPEIYLSAQIEEVGLTSDGAMKTPKVPSKVAWYKFGVVPGNIGTAVIAGHSGWKNGKPVVFDDLHKLKIGSTLYVEYDSGATMAFVVSNIVTYTKDQIVPDVFFSNDSLSHLNLITCEGSWSSTDKSYSNRLVVFAIKK